MPSYVSGMTIMRRILRANLFELNGPLDPIPVASGLTAFATNLYRKSTGDHAIMDLSNMRKKYKGDEDVSCICNLTSEITGSL